MLFLIRYLFKLELKRILVLTALRDMQNRVTLKNYVKERKLFFSPTTINKFCFKIFI